MAAAKGVLALRAKPSLADIEQINAAAAKVPRNDPIVLKLPRDLDTTLLGASTVAKLIATLSQRTGRLVIRDWVDSWKTAKATDRFISQIDGIAALIHSATVSDGRIENIKAEKLPPQVWKAFNEHLLVTAKIEDDVGATRTFVAVDPDFAVPIGLELSTPTKPEEKPGYASFRESIDTILRQFRESTETKFPEKEDAEERLYKFVYETFLNTFEHGRFRPDIASPERLQISPGLRYVAFRQHTANYTAEVSSRARGFPELERYFSWRDQIEPKGRRTKVKRFLEITVADNGLGILGHYLATRTQSIGTRTERLKLLRSLLSTNLSSKPISGVGEGLPDALSALAKLRGFVSLRSDEFWLYRDFSNNPGLPRQEQAGVGPIDLIQVSIAPDSLKRMAGTQFSVFVDFAP